MTFYTLCQIKESLYEYQSYLFDMKRKIGEEIDKKKISNDYNPFFIDRKAEEDYNKEMHKLIKEHDTFDKNAIHLSGLIEEINKIEVI